MGVPMLKRCCCCVSLQTGTIIIAYLYSVWNLLELTIYSLLVTFGPMKKDAAGDAEQVSMNKYALYVATAAVNGVHLLCSLLLIVAAYKKLPYLTLPWTIVTGIMAALYFVLCLTGMSLMLQDTGSLLGFEAVLIFLKFARTCFSVYCIMVVHSRHKQIMAEEDESRFQHSGRIYSAVKTDENPL
ncbi:uncharacterized protein [Choristoneura fumiferana]|uniref:uncharacterized protein n=1 Tax=Choristoneura fumiferana TaxID=7141 RepID=UPI003D15ECF4